MDENRVHGIDKKTSGSIKETVGKAVDDADTEAEGGAKKPQGKAQDLAGGAKDALRGTLQE